ncbi:MAG TPA: hypothetical protein VN716_23685 [Vicinamibacterales bacterium]|nr:hypothetical protein [Vicinamibacterales bacterium]
MSRHESPLTVMTGKWGVVSSPMDGVDAALHAAAIAAHSAIRSTWT